jgi:hypothetical protein
MKPCPRDGSTKRKHYLGPNSPSECVICHRRRQKREWSRRTSRITADLRDKTHPPPVPYVAELLTPRAPEPAKPLRASSTEARILCAMGVWCDEEMSA